MAKFRKKPVVIEAYQWQPGMNTNGIVEEGVYKDGPFEGCKYAQIKSLEGPHLIKPGYWVITGIKGEHYGCEPEIFEATYEEVQDGKETR